MTREEALERARAFPLPADQCLRADAMTWHREPEYFWRVTEAARRPGRSCWSFYVDYCGAGLVIGATQLLVVWEDTGEVERASYGE